MTHHLMAALVTGMVLGCLFGLSMGVFAVYVWLEPPGETEFQPGTIRRDLDGNVHVTPPLHIQGVMLFRCCSTSFNGGPEVCCHEGQTCEEFQASIQLEPVL